MISLRPILSLLLLIISVAANFAQADSRYALSAGFGRQKVGLPLVQLLEFPAHSSLSVEAIRKYGNGDNKSFYQTLNLITFRNSSLGSGYQIQSNLGKEIPLRKTLSICPELGLGISHRFLAKEAFHFVNGSYQLDRDYGSLRPVLNFRTLIGYRTQSILVFVSYQLSAELFYNKDLPLLPVNYLHLGMRYSLKSNGK